MNKVEIVKEAAEKALAAEAGRTGQLLARAEKLVAGTVIVIGFQLFNILGLLQSSFWAKATGGLSLVVLGLGLFFGFCSLGLKGYASYPRGDKLWETLKSGEVSDEAAEQAIIQLLLKNREQNAKLNDVKTTSLVRCGWLLFSGVLLVVVSLVLFSVASLSA